MAQRRKSWCWNYFLLENDSKLKCKSCDFLLSYKHKNTSGMIKHLKSIHNISVGPSTRDVNSLLQGSQKANIDNLLLEMIYKGFHPLSIVEDKTFQHFVMALNPNYVIPSKKTVKTDILNTYEILRNNMQITLDGIQNVTLTIDYWTSNVNESYLTVTAHYISNDYKLENYIIDTEKFSDRNSPEDIAEILKNIIHNWKIHVLAIVTDGSPKMLSAIALLEDVQHIKCFAHTLNVVIKQSMESFSEIQEIRRKCGDIIQYLKHNNNAIKVLQKMQENVSEPQLDLILEVETRWNSTYYMLQKFVDLKELITATLIASESNLDFINDNEFQIIEDVVKILKPFEEITVEMSTEEYVNISKILVIRNNLLVYLDELTFSGNSIAYYFKSEITNNMKAKMDYLDKSDIIIMASILDPRFKLLSFLTEIERGHARAKLIYECNLLVQENMEEKYITPDNPVTPSCSIWKRYDEEVKHQDSYEPTDTATFDEVQSYLGDRYLDRSNNPLNYWNEKKTKYPHLAVLAQKYLAKSSTHDALFILVTTISPTAMQWSVAKLKPTSLVNNQPTPVCYQNA